MAKSLIEFQKTTPVIKHLDNIRDIYQRLDFYVNSNRHSVAFNSIKNRWVKMFSDKSGSYVSMLLNLFNSFDLPTDEICNNRIKDKLERYQNGDYQDLFYFQNEDEKDEFIKLFASETIRFIDNNYINWNFTKFNDVFVMFPNEEYNSVDYKIISVLNSTIEYSDKEQRITAISFIQNDKEFYITDDFFRVYEKNKKEIPIFESENTIGQCTAIFVASSKSSDDKRIRRPILNTNYLFNYLSAELQRCKAGRMSPTMIYKIIEKINSCDFKDGQHICNLGFLGTQKEIEINGQTQVDFEYLIKDNNLVNCPKCNEKPFSFYHNGLGQSTGVYDPDPANPTDIEKLVKVVDVPNLDHFYKELEYSENDLLVSSCGIENEAQKSAINEKQVLSGVESTQNILRRHSKYSQYFKQTILTWLAKFFYGQDFGQIHCISAQNFFFQDPNELLVKKEKEANPVIKENLEEEFFKTKYKHNSFKAERNIKIAEIIPYSSVNDDTFIKYWEQGIVSQEEVKFRSNHKFYINLYETQKGVSITEIDTDIARKEILEIIKNS